MEEVQVKYHDDGLLIVARSGERGAEPIRLVVEIRTAKGAKPALNCALRSTIMRHVENFLQPSVGQPSVGQGGVNLSTQALEEATDRFAGMNRAADIREW